MNSPLTRAGAVIGLLALLCAAIFGASFAASAKAASGTPHLILTLKDGDVDIELLPDVAPKHVERIITLTQQGAYDGVVFHRVIDGFMAQTGDVKFGKSGSPAFDLAMAGTGGSDLPDVKAEFSSIHYDPGTVGAARSQDPDSFNSQFFITFADAGFLDGQYTVFGKVVAGMDHVNAIKKGDPQTGSMPDPDKIISAKIEYR
ncbi:MAG TPA: peptidylprolyl isomerase [Devosia sp.]|nr:peptidylprolyl isomerase [Devosia sp.]